MNNKVKIIILIRYFFIITLFFLITGCAAPFKPANIDPSTGQFPASVDVDEKYIKIYRPLAGIEEANYIYLRAYSPYGDEAFYCFIKDALLKMGFKEVVSEEELSQMIIQSGLSDHVTSISDLISLSNLAKTTGPFLVLEASVFRIGETVYRFDLQLIEPFSGDTYLEISRIRTVWLDFDNEVNYPILNVIKRWYDESKKLPYEKQKSKPSLRGTI